MSEGPPLPSPRRQLFELDDARAAVDGGAGADLVDGGAADVAGDQIIVLLHFDHVAAVAGRIQSFHR